jgi:hypothetical protein
MSKQMDKPNGIDLLATLIDLLAEQEGVKITYELTEENERCEKIHHVQRR